MMKRLLGLGRDWDAMLDASYGIFRLIRPVFLEPNSGILPSVFSGDAFPAIGCKLLDLKFVFGFSCV
jgi:hypothetical protein